MNSFRRKKMEDYNFSCQFTADLIAMNTAGLTSSQPFQLCMYKWPDSLLAAGLIIVHFPGSADILC